jgi:hypothetical protein
LNMLNDDTSAFVKYQGRMVNLAPLLGQGYYNWLPTIILIISFLVFMNIHGKIMRFFVKDTYNYEPIHPANTVCEEGRNFINQGTEWSHSQCSSCPRGT